ncbi:MAG: 3-oxoadipate enol-lactonase [Pseudonocardia sp.]|nr:3-oxoadipate enol-lactonase [Pseudonocardia sp.]
MTGDHPPTTLHHRSDGPPGAPVLVLGPSLGTDLHLFDAQVAALAGRYRIVRFDLPGHGGSPAPDGLCSIRGMARDVLALLDRLGIDRFHYAGVSIGGAIGQQLAVDHPERLRSLTVCASAARFADPDSWPQRAATVRAHGTEAMLASRPGTWFTHRFADNHSAEATRLLDMLRATTREGYAGCCEAIATFDLRERLGAISVPTLAIAGADDPATPPEMVRLISDGVQHGGFVLIRDAAHLVNAERPDQVTTALVEHLERVDGPASASDDAGRRR